MNDSDGTAEPPAAEPAAEPAAPLRGFVVSHTHWDRAWYLPFERFRVRLVRMVDRLLDLLDADADFRAFTLDGQAVLIEDYLEIRPEAEGRVRAAIASGRLLTGPWYTLPDLFLVSGEAVVRNLQAGLALCARFGGGMREGYLPDPFGHTAQMPQILRGFGIDSYVFMRGLDAGTLATHGAVFDWRAPDGSAVLAVYQRDGYFPAGALGHPSVYGRFDGHAPEPALAAAQIAAAVALQSPLQAARSVLLSNGFDHMPEQPEIPALLREVRVAGVALEHTTLPDFFDALRAETADGTTGDGRTPRQTFEGDLLGNADHPVLRGVNSARLYLKQQNHAAQSVLTRVAEPICVLAEAAGLGQPTRPFLRHAWRQLLRNHPHDDICGCSVDAVHGDDEARYRAVMETAEELILEHLEALLADGFVPPARTGAPATPATMGPGEAHDMRPAGPLPTGTDVFVFNPLPHDRTVDVEADVLFPNPDGEFGPPAADLPLAAVGPAGQTVPLNVLASEAPVLRSRFLEGTWGRRYRVRLRVAVPALGYALVHVFQDAGAAPAPLPLSEEVRLSVGPLGPVLHAHDATLGPLVAFEYALDVGDTYSHGPVLMHGPWTAEYRGTEALPDGTLVVRHRLGVPGSYSHAAGAGAPVGIDIETRVRLQPDGTAQLAVSYDNAARDGRLRLVVPTATDATSVLADAAFRLARRERLDAPRTPETDPERWAGYPGELDYPTHHQGDFSVAEGARHVAFVANRGLPEVELLGADGETHLAVTLHRAVGWLSVGGGRIRRCQAGPQVPTPGAQCLGAVRADVAVGVEPVGVEPASAVDAAVRRAEAFAHAPFVREIPLLPFIRGADAPAGTRPRAASLLRLGGDGVRLTSFKPHDTDAGVVVVRLHNTADAPRRADLEFGIAVTEARRTDLREVWAAGEPLPLDGNTLALDLGPHQIATMLLRTHSL